MANPKAQIYSVPLQGEGSEINLTTYKTDISQFSGFNSKNAPFYGGTLSPMWYKKENTITTETYITPNGDKYYVENGHLYKNGASVMMFSNKSFASRILEDDDYYDYREDGFYIKRTVSSSGDSLYTLVTPYGHKDVGMSGEAKTYLYKYTGNGRANNPIYCAIIDSEIHMFTARDKYEYRWISRPDDITYVCICNSGVSDYDCLTFCINDAIILYNETSLATSKVTSIFLANNENTFLYVSDKGTIENYIPTRLLGLTDTSIYAIRKTLIPSTSRDELVVNSENNIKYKVVDSTGAEVDGKISTLSAKYIV